MEGAAVERPRIVPAGGDRASVHGTAVAVGSHGLLLTGPPGAGKSETAAQILALGGRLVADDLVLILRQGGGLVLHAPPGAGAGGAIELRGLGIARLDPSPPTPLRAILWLGPSSGRLPEPEAMTILGVPTPLLRHPATPALAAKLALVLRTTDAAATGPAW